MTAYQLLAAFPTLTLDSGCTVTVEAIDPATGATVTGVAVSSVTLYGVNMAPDDVPVPDDVLPLFVSIPADEAA